MSNLESFQVAGIPMAVRPPANPRSNTPLIVLWHGFGVPNSSEMLAEVLPLNEVQAWKAYLGLPLFGRRLPPGGLDKIMRRQMEDYVLQLLLPSIEPAMQELPNVVQALQAQSGIDEKAGLGLFGFSAGGMAALLTAVESSLPITTMVLAGVTKDLVSAVDTYERSMRQYYPMLKEQFPRIEERDIEYYWSEASDAAKQRLDFVARASEIVHRQPIPAIVNIDWRFVIQHSMFDVALQIPSGMESSSPAEQSRPQTKRYGAGLTLKQVKSVGAREGKAVNFFRLYTIYTTYYQIFALQNIDIYNPN